MRKAMCVLATVGLLASGGLAACGTDAPPTIDRSGPGKVGVILPDTASSQRWSTDDPKFLKDAFKAAGVEVEIENALGDKRNFQDIAAKMIADGVTVLMITSLDSRSGKAVLDQARAKNVATIDYDRLTLNGGAQFYVSFDNVAVGKMQAEGLVRCLAEKGTRLPVVAELNGPPTDNNATLFKQGYDAILQDQYDLGNFRKGPDQSVPNWDNAEAGLIFEQMMAQTKGKINGVLAANDGLGHAAITVLTKNHTNGKVPVTGQDATVQGLQHILAGDQCMTVYKAIRTEANAAAELAISLVKGQPKDLTQVVKDPVSGGDVPAVLLTPKLIYRNNIKDVVRDGFVTRAQICTAALKKSCADAGLR